MEAILKFTRSKFARGLVGGLCGALFTVSILFTLIGFFNWFALKNGLDEPAWAPTARIAVLAAGAGWAILSGLVSGSGNLNHTRVGRFFYYLGGSALAWVLVGSASTILFFFTIMRNVPTAREISLGAAPTGELGMVIGAVLSVPMGLLFGGVLTGWVLPIFGIDTEIHHGAPEGEPEWMRYFSVDVNHKVIGIQYGVTGIIVLLIGGLLAILFRLELAYPGMQLMTTDQYNSLFSAHGMIMIAAVFLGVGALINYLAPVMIGAADMAFPRLNAFSFWVGIPSVFLLMLGLFLGWDTGWVGYPPHSTTTPALGVSMFLLGFYMNGFSSIAGGLNLLVTVATMRAKGMSLFRMPIFVWTAIATSIMQFSATQTVGVALSMVVLQRTVGMGFFDPTTMPPGDPVLYQHLFWFYSHPAVYVWVVPGFGIISEILPVFARKPLYGYKWVAMSSLGIALVGFIVWAHHMFTSGMSEGLRIPFMVATMFVGVPTGVKFFSWLGTIWGGKMIFPTPMLFILGAISVFLLGGLSGPILATVPTDLYLHDTYWVVGHFHATIFGGFVFPFFGALYFWFPKMTGRMYNENLGKLHFWLMLPAFWVMSIGQMVVGLMGMRRRIADYDPALGIDFVQSLVTASTLVIGWSVLIMIYNLWTSATAKELAPENPWGAQSPEWLAPSPLPEFNFLQPIEIVGEPYEYGLENWTYVQNATPAAGD